MRKLTQTEMTERRTEEAEVTWTDPRTGAETVLGTVPVEIREAASRLVPAFSWSTAERLRALRAPRDRGIVCPLRPGGTASPSECARCARTSADGRACYEGVK